MIKLGLIGVGRWGNRYLETMKRLQETQNIDAKIAYVCRRDTEKMHSPPPEGTNWWLFWEDVLTWSDVQGVIIATPPQTHYKIAAVALTAGVPILIEKPATLSSRDTEGLLHLAHAKKTPVMVGHVHLYSQPFRQMVEIIKATKEPIAKIVSDSHGVGPERNYSILWDWAPHDLSMIYDLLGDTTLTVDNAQVYGNEKACRWEFAMTADGHRAQNTQIYVNVGNTYDEKKKLISVVFASGTSISYDGVKNELAVDNHKISESNEHPLDNQLRTFVSLCQAFVPISPLPVRTIARDLELSTKIARVIEAVERKAL